MLHLCSIVKDEAKCIARTFESVAGVVDYVTVLDTGSTDETAKVIKETCEKIALPCFLFDHLQFGGPYLTASGSFDYAAARNKVLDLARIAKYALSLSADETLHGGDKLRAFLESYEGDEFAFLVEVRTPQGAIDYPRVLRVGSPWRYVGAIHEEPRYEGDPARKPTVKIPGCWVDYVPSDIERHNRRLAERDLPGLTAQLSVETDDNTRIRLFHLLAQTHIGLASVAFNGTDVNRMVAASQHQCAALGYYLLVINYDKISIEEKFHAKWKLLNTAEMLGLYDNSEMLKHLTELAKCEPKNPAIAYKLAMYTANADSHAGLQAAYRAAKIAREAVADLDHPHDPYGLLWRPHLLAAMCAKALKHGPAVKKSVEAGLAAGAPPEAFLEFE